jgi:hypothetical protein
VVASKIHNVILSFLNYSLVSRFALFLLSIPTTMRGLLKKQQGINISNSSIHDIDIPNQEPDDIDIPNQEPVYPGNSREIENPRPDANHTNNPAESCEAAYDTLARKETKVVHVLRVLVLLLLFVTATLTSVGVYLYTSNEEKQHFEVEYQFNAERIIESFHDSVVRRLGAINSMATAITSYAIDTNQTFPFVTVPNFEIRGSDLRIQADAATVQWTPLVTDETRVAWEDYALENRYQVEISFQEDSQQRKKQDNEFGLTNATGTSDRMLQQSQQLTILDDGTGYHPSIWSVGAVSPRGDEPEGSGPYLPLWQSR